MSKIRLYFLHFLKKNKNNSTQKKRNYSYYNDIFFNYANRNYRGLVREMESINL